MSTAMWRLPLATLRLTSRFLSASVNCPFRFQRRARPIHTFPVAASSADGHFTRILENGDSLAEPPLEVNITAYEQVTIDLFEKNADKYPYVVHQGDDSDDDVFLEVRRLRTSSRRPEESVIREWAEKTAAFFRETELDPASSSKKLFLAYDWFLLGRVYRIAGQQLLKTAVGQLLGDGPLIESLSVQEFVFAMFLMGELRWRPLTSSSPSRETRSSSLDGISQVPSHIERAILLRMDAMSAEEFGIVVHAAYKCKFELRHPNKELKNAMFDRLTRLDEAEMRTEVNPVPSMVKLLRSRSSPDHGRIREVVEHYTPHVGELPVLARIRLFSMVAQRCTLSPLTEAFVEAFVRSLRPFDGCRMKELEIIAYGLMWTNFDDLETYRELLEAAGSVGASGPGCGRSFLFLNGFVAMAGCFERPNLERMFDVANACIDLDDVVGSGIAVHAEISGYGLDELKRDWKRSGMLNRNSLLEIAKLDCALDVDFPEYDGPRLRKDLRKRLLDLIMYREETALATRLLNSAEIDLKSCLGGSSNNSVRRCKLLPHSTSEDLLFAMDGGPVPQDFLGRLEDKTVTARPDDRRRWCVVSVPKHTELDSNSNPYGSQTCKMRQLTSLGYEVMLVPSFSYQRVAGSHKGTSYFKNLLDNTFHQRREDRRGS